MLTITLRESESARSPFARSVIRLESMPPGQVAKRINPTVKAGVGAAQPDCGEKLHAFAAEPVQLAYSCSISAGLTDYVVFKYSKLVRTDHESRRKLL